MIFQTYGIRLLDIHDHLRLRLDPGVVINSVTAPPPLRDHTLRYMKLAALAEK